MGWFGKKALNNICPSMCNPIIVNQTNASVVVFLDRGVLYNKQILQPGEAVAMTRRDTAGTVVPYRIHAVVGDEKALPSRTQSMKNLVSTAAIPTAFVIGTLMAASTAGTMSGPSAALSRAAGGIVVRGLVIDAAALAAGSLTASRAAFFADQLIESHPENFSAKSGHCMPGQRYVLVQGGIETPLTLTTITEKKFRQVEINGDCKVPMDTLREKVEFYTPSLFRFSSKVTGPNEEEIAAIEAANPEPIAAIQEEEEATATTTTPAIESAPRASVAATAPPSAEEESEEDRQLREALAESASAPQHESEEDKQLREAIEASLKLEEDRKQKEQAYNKQIKDDKRIPVKLF